MAVAYRANPTPTKEQETDKLGKLRLIMTLNKYREMSRVGEDQRRARDRKGAQLAGGQLWREGITAGRTAITANQAVSMVERITGMVTRYYPSPKVEALNDGDDDGALMVQGAINTVWRVNKMQDLAKHSMMLTTFTRPDLWYTWWDPKAMGGIGWPKTRDIPGHRCIIDDRFQRVEDMEFCGFREKTTRAKLIQMFPEKADEIEAAMQAGADLNEQYPDPLRLSPSLSPNTTDRLVSTDGGVTYQGKSTVRTNRKKGGDPLYAEVEPEFLWIDDPTPIKRERPKTDEYGRQLYRLLRTANGGFDMETTGHEVAQTPFGPVLQPVLKPKKEPVMEEATEFKYPHRRFIAWLPDDRVIFADLRWDGPVPLAAQRDTYPLTGFWSEGRGLRLSSLAIARNILYTIIFERLKLSLGGTWLANFSSGLKRNKLTPEDGQVWYVNSIDGVKQFPVTPLDAAYFQMLGIINQEMKDLLGISQPMQGEAAGRADSPATYDKLIEAGGSILVSIAQMLETTIADWAEINMWYIQHMFRPEHYIELEVADGSTNWVRANALLMRGKMAVSIEPGSMLAWSESAAWERAKEFHALGIYALPMLIKQGHVPHGREALAQVGRLAGQPDKAYLLGAAQRPAQGKPPKAPQPGSHKAGASAATH